MSLTVGERVVLLVSYVPVGPDAGSLGTVRAATSRPGTYQGEGPWYAIDWDEGDPGYARGAHLEVTAP